MTEKDNSIVEKDLLKISDSTAEALKVNGKIVEETNGYLLRINRDYTGGCKFPPEYPMNCNECKLQSLTKCDWENGEYCEAKQSQIWKWNLYVTGLMSPLKLYDKPKKPWYDRILSSLHLLLWLSLSFTFANLIIRLLNMIG